MNLTDTQCKEIISTLYKNGKSPAARILADWHSFGGRIGQYSHMIQYGSSKPREFDSWELERKLGGYDVIVEIHIPGMRGWNDWIPGKTKYSTNLEDVAKECVYDSGTSIDIWKVPTSIIRKLEKETKMETLDSIKENSISLKQLKQFLAEANKNKPQYTIQYIEFRMAKDDWKDGEDLKDRHYWDAYVPNKRFDSIEDALKYVNENYIEYAWDKTDWFYNEDGRFYSDYLVTKDEKEVTNDDIEKWKKGEKELYNLNCDVTIVKCAPVSLYDAKAEGFDE